MADKPHSVEVKFERFTAVDVLIDGKSAGNKDGLALVGFDLSVRPHDIPTLKLIYYPKNVGIHTMAKVVTEVDGDGDKKHGNQPAVSSEAVGLS